MKRKIFLIPSLIFSLVLSLAAQQTTGNLEGRILDLDGKPISDVNIEVNSTSLQGTRGASTNELGSFILLALPPGMYKLKITHITFHDINIDEIAVSLGKTSTVGEIQMTPHTLEIPEVIVYGKRPLIDPASSSFGSNLSSAEFESLPIERNFREMAIFLPQSNISYFGDEVNIAGGTGRETKYFVDGIDVSDTHKGSVEANLPYNFIKEVQLTTGGYEAEYRSSLGGLINVVTHSGGNKMYGSVFGFYTADWLAASPKAGLNDPAEGAFSNYDLGFGVGGAIVRDQLWYYAAYNPTFIQRDVALPGLDSTAVDETVIHAFAAKLTWKPLPQLNIVLTSTGDPAERNAIGNITGFAGESPSAIENPEVYTSKHQLGGVNFSLKGSYTVGNNLIFDASLFRTMRNEIDEPSNNEALFIDTETGVWSGGSTLESSQERTTAGVNLSATLLTGDHLLKTGIEYRDHGLNYYISDQIIYRLDDSTFFKIKEQSSGIYHNRIPSLFIQDSWKIGPHLLLNAGLRWDGQFLVASNGEVAQTITNQFQPRIGFVFIPDDAGKHKIFGSFGRFAQELHTSILPIYYSESGYFTRLRYSSDPRMGNAAGDTLWHENKNIYPEIPGLRGQYYDEFSLGYEQMLGFKSKVGVKGIYRTLRDAIDDGWIASESTFGFGNPGSGDLTDFPEAKRDYLALVLSIERHSITGLNFLISYVLSSNYGNYPGLFDNIYKMVSTNVNLQFDDIESLKNGTGLLPNDRTHTFKFLGSYKFIFGLDIGASFTWQSGSPLSEMADYVSGRPFFISQRGTAGRTPSIWDLNLRLAYKLPLQSYFKARLFLDLFHIASQREAVQFIEQKYLTYYKNEELEDENPFYGEATKYQAPMSIRLGLVIDF